MTVLLIVYFIVEGYRDPRVEVINDRDIVVSHPQSGFSVTYRKDGDAPVLFAIDGIDRSDDPSKVKF